MKIMQKKVIIPLIILIIIAAIITILLIISSKKANTADSRQLKTYTVKSTSQIETVEVSGNIEPVTSQELGFNSAGEVKAILVKNGDRVGPGTPLISLDNLNEQGRHYAN